MAGTNTEKPTSKDEKMKQQAIQNTNQSKKEIQKQNQKKIPQEKSQEKKEEDKKSEETNEKQKEEKTAENESQEKKEEDKKTKRKDSKKEKKSEAKVNVRDLPLSTKVSAAICKFIKNKEIKRAIEDLNKVTNKKMAVPMKGEYPHQKRIMSGKYPVKAAGEFRQLLKSLRANAVENGLEKPVIRTAIANKGQRPMAKFGRWQRKRTHLTIIAKESIGENKIRKNKKNKSKPREKQKE